MVSAVPAAGFTASGESPLAGGGEACILFCWKVRGDTRR